MKHPRAASRTEREESKLREFLYDHLRGSSRPQRLGYERRMERRIRHMKPDVLDRLLRGEVDE